MTETIHQKRGISRLEDGHLEIRKDQHTALMNFFSFLLHYLRLTYRGVECRFHQYLVEADC